MDLKRVKIDDIKIPEVRVTSRFTEEQWEQFRESYKTTGELDPVLVYNVNGELWLSDGLHRLVESKNNGATEIWAIVLPGDLADVFTKNLLLDHLRGKHPASDMIKVVRLLWKELNLDSEKISEKMGVSRDYVEKLQKISELTPFCLEQLDQERIHVGHAAALARLKDPVKQETVCNQLLLYHWSVKDTEQYVREVEALIEEPEPAPTDEEPKPPPMIQCRFCRQLYPIEQISNPNTCVGCAGVLYGAIAQAEAEYKKDQEAKTE